MIPYWPRLLCAAAAFVAILLGDADRFSVAFAVWFALLALMPYEKSI